MSCNIPEVRKRKDKDLEVIDVALQAKLDVFSVGVSTQEKLLVDIKMTGLCVISVRQPEINNLILGLQ